jgi:hypothetical protein
LAALAVVVVAGLEAVAGLDLLEDQPSVPPLFIFSITSIPRSAPKPEER